MIRAAAEPLTDADQRGAASLEPPSEPRAQLIVRLTQLALSAPDIPSAMLPALEVLVERTAAAGSAYFQVGGGMFEARSASGVML